MPALLIDFNDNCSLNIRGLMTNFIISNLWLAAEKCCCCYWTTIYISIINLRCLSVCVSLTIRPIIKMLTWVILMKVKDNFSFCPFCPFFCLFFCLSVPCGGKSHKSDIFESAIAGMWYDLGISYVNYSFNKSI